MLERLLPDDVVVVETGMDLLEAELFPEEIESLGRAVEKRRREFVTTRACARRALERLGIAPAPIVNGPKGEPIWPTAVVGSITHCSDYRACAVARKDCVASIGIDVELHEPLPSGVLEAVASATERRALRGYGVSASWDRLLFSAKESVYKVWFPLMHRGLGFEDVELSIDASSGTFTARFIVPGPVIDGVRLSQLHGRWCVDAARIATAIALPRNEV
jgi:4'-phosphopantetheinyl transferase EntD